MIFIQGTGRQERRYRASTGRRRVPKRDSGKKSEKYTTWHIKMALTVLRCFRNITYVHRTCSLCYSACKICRKSQWFKSWARSPLTSEKDCVCVCVMGHSTPPSDEYQRQTMSTRWRWRWRSKTKKQTNKPKKKKNDCTITGGSDKIGEFRCKKWAKEENIVLFYRADPKTLGRFPHKFRRLLSCLISNKYISILNKINIIRRYEIASCLTRSCYTMLLCFFCFCYAFVFRSSSDSTDGFFSVCLGHGTRHLRHTLTLSSIHRQNTI